MRVLLLHNRYRMPGGEERAVADLRALLSSRGHVVRVLERSSATAGRARAAGALVAGGLDPEEVRRAVDELGAEVVHAHNLHPLFGARALEAARAAGARTIVHLHNFRLFCSIAVAYREGAICFRCRGRDARPGVRLRCRDSVPEAVAYAVGLSRQQPKIFEAADAFVAVSGATGARLIELGLPASKTRTLVNFVPAAAFAERSRAGAGGYALASGRLVEEKGFDTAIAAARAAGVPLVIAGEGPDAARLRELATGHDVSFTGRVPGEALARLRAGAGAVLVPSRWEEPCPYAALDALAAGVPVLAAARGGLTELVETAAALDPGDVEGWAAALGGLWRDPAARQRQGEAALARARQLLDEERYHERLLEIYGGG